MDSAPGLLRRYECDERTTTWLGRSEVALLHGAVMP
jgi:hypothetical protein